MDISIKDATELIDPLVSEQGHAHAPSAVRLHWLALTQGDTSVTSYSRVRQEQGSTVWTVLGMKGDSLLVLEMRAEGEFWTLNHEEGIQAELTRADVLPVDSIERIQLHGTQDLLRSGGAVWRVDSKWTLHLKGGEAFTIPEAESRQEGWHLRVDGFIAAVRAARFGS